MVRIFYNLALLTAVIAGAPWWLWRIATTDKYRQGMAQRLAMKQEVGKPPEMTDPYRLGWVAEP